MDVVMGTDGSVSDGVETVLGGESREGDIRRLSYVGIVVVDGAGAGVGAIVVVVVAVVAVAVMLGAISAAWMNFVALFKRKKPAALVWCIRKAVEEHSHSGSRRGKAVGIVGDFFFSQ